ncbi:acetyltransferase domain-containing protein [Nemania serpens]|nr:acetyltransferase domain-containing protein [Nemania serpens]
MATPNVPESPHVPPPAPAPAQASAPTAPKARVKTTWPAVGSQSSRTPIRTERLLIRPFDVAYTEAIFELRKQPEVMLWTAVGVPDQDIEQSRAFAKRFQPPRDLVSFQFVILYVGDAGENGDADGVLVGVGGVHRITPEEGWPEVGYMFRKEYWGKGLGTEFLQGLTKAWWALPRGEIELEVDVASVGKVAEGEGEKKDDAVIQVPELLTAIIEAGNIGSRRVLEKAGFKEYMTWSEPDSRVGFEGLNAALAKFRLEAPQS